MITTLKCENCENFTKLGDYCKKGKICSNYGKCEDWKQKKVKEEDMPKTETYTSKEEKSEVKNKWIIHRTLRKINKETYVGHRTGTDYDDVKCGYTMIYQKEYATRYDEKEAIKIRDELNEQRVGKRYLWVISKV